jgi:hypothetical protein
LFEDGDVLAKANQEIMMLQIEEKTMSRQLEDMKIIASGRFF